ncbi:hypothetical protein [Methylovulum psychrotolerans]|uniref:Uncharacterized protein n=1 Tax=Methylovulum psychrotolerans TaxID=1704499 RepID=A0A2S5CGG8_9GAMM|nr:hypothetical protein [Methylovulum psychrotolerans]POZ49895.1 hypothetical protein AADEFJLK_04341 [Methylovulum psychrotolerans]
MGSYLNRLRALPVVVSTSITRPANTTTYAAGDVIANSASTPTAIVVANCVALKGGYGRISSAQLISSAAPALPLQADVFLFSAVVGLDNDNAAFTPTDAEMLTLVATLQFYDDHAPFDSTGAAVASFKSPRYADGDASSNRVYFSQPLPNKIFKTADTTKNLWAVVVARNAYVPASGETFTLFIDIEQD